MNSQTELHLLHHADSHVSCDHKFAPESQVALDYVLRQGPYHLELLSATEENSCERISVLGL